MSQYTFVGEFVLKARKLEKKNLLGKEGLGK